MRERLRINRHCVVANLYDHTAMPRDFSHTTNFVGIDPVGWPSLAVKDANDVSISAAGEGNGGISTHADADKKTSAAPIDVVERRDMGPNY